MVIKLGNTAAVPLPSTLPLPMLMPQPGSEPHSPLSRVTPSKGLLVAGLALDKGTTGETFERGCTGPKSKPDPRSISALQPTAFNFNPYINPWPVDTLTLPAKPSFAVISAHVPCDRKLDPLHDSSFHCRVFLQRAFPRPSFL